jgi:hypothetical protein
MVGLAEIGSAVDRDSKITSESQNSGHAAVPLIVSPAVPRVSGLRGDSRRRVRSDQYQEGLLWRWTGRQWMHAAQNPCGSVDSLLRLVADIVVRAGIHTMTSFRQSNGNDPLAWWSCLFVDDEQDSTRLVERRELTGVKHIAAQADNGNNDGH